MSDLDRFPDVQARDRTVIGVVAIVVLLIQGGIFLIYFGGTFHTNYPINFTAFWLSYTLWAGLAFGISARKTSQARRGRELSSIFLVLLFATLALSKYSQAFESANLAFPGFFVGIGIYVGAIVVKRHTSYRKPFRTARILPKEGH